MAFDRNNKLNGDAERDTDQQARQREREPSVHKKRPISDPKKKCIDGRKRPSLGRRVFFSLWPVIPHERCSFDAPGVIAQSRHFGADLSHSTVFFQALLGNTAPSSSAFAG